MPPQADGLDAMDAMADRRKHRQVPPPKKQGLPPAQSPPQQPAPADEGEQPSQETGERHSATQPTEPQPVEPPESQPDETPAPPTAARASSGRRGARARSRRDTGPRIDWTADAKAVRAALTSYQAQLRKLADREREIRKLAKRVPAEDLAAIVQRVAQDTNGNRDALADATGVDRDGES